MKFGIRTFGASPADIIDLTADEYAQAVSARNALVAMIGVEQKFDLVLENHADYERELLGLALNRSLHLADLQWQGSQQDIAVVSRRLANLLSAGRLYIDQVKHDLSSTFGSVHEVTDAVQHKFSEQYDARLGYRVMEALRNVMQHCILPVHQLGYPTDVLSGPGVRFRVVPKVEVARLADVGFKAVLKELETRGEYVPLTPFAREYVEGLGHVHEALREITALHRDRWDSAVASIQQRGAGRWGGGDKRAFLIFQYDEAGNVIASAQIFTELTEYRRTLERRNSLLTDFASRYISSACLESDA